MDWYVFHKRVVSRIRRERESLRRFATAHLAVLTTAARWWIRPPQRSHGLPGELVVSLTSHPPRFGTLALSLRCLLSQTIKADRTILWISDSDSALLPSDVIRLQQYGLEVRVTNNIGSYTKIIPTLQAFPKAFIVTADDDVFYEVNWLEALIESWDDRMDQVVCHRAHRITTDNLGFPRPYKEWVFDTREPLESSTILFPTGCRGILYPPGSLGVDVTDEASFLRLAPNADDLWLYWMGRRTGVTYKLVRIQAPMVCWPGSQHSGLYHCNLGAGGNDEKIRRLGAELGYPAFDRNCNETFLRGSARPNLMSTTLD